MPKGKGTGSEASLPGHKLPQQPKQPKPYAMLEIHQTQTGHLLQLQGSYGRVVVVGDVHGCYFELQQLLSSIDFRHTDLLISLGDVINRGPYSYQTLRFFMNTPNAYMVRGNHEQRFLRLLRGQRQPHWSEYLTLGQIPHAERARVVSYLAQLPEIIHCPEVVATHALLNGQLPLHQQPPGYTNASEGTVATCNAQGVPHWFEAWRLQYPDTPPVCIGHEAYQRVELVPGQLYALDTKVDRGRALSALVLPEYQVVQVAAARNHRLLNKATFYRPQLHDSPHELPIELVLHYDQSQELPGLIDHLAQRYGLAPLLPLLAERVQHRALQSPLAYPDALERLATNSMQHRILHHLLHTPNPSLASLMAQLPDSLSFAAMAQVLLQLAQPNHSI